MTYRIKAEKYTAVVARKLNGTYTVVNEENRMRGRDRAIIKHCVGSYEIVYGCVTTATSSQDCSAYQSRLSSPLDPWK